MSKEKVYNKFLRCVETGEELNVEYNDWESVEDDASQVEENDSATDEQRKMLRLIQRYLREFHLCCSRLVVIGFNSGKYVLNLIKQKLP